MKSLIAILKMLNFVIIINFSIIFVTTLSMCFLMCKTSLKNDQSSRVNKNIFQLIRSRFHFFWLETCKDCKFSIVSIKMWSLWLFMFMIWQRIRWFVKNAKTKIKLIVVLLKIYLNLKISSSDDVSNFMSKILIIFNKFSVFSW